MAFYSGLIEETHDADAGDDAADYDNDDSPSRWRLGTLCVASLDRQSFQKLTRSLHCCRRNERTDVS